MIYFRRLAEFDQRNILDRKLAILSNNDWISDCTNHRHQDISICNERSLVDLFKIILRNQVCIVEVDTTVFDVLGCNERESLKMVFGAVMCSIPNVANLTHRLDRPLRINPDGGFVRGEDLVGAFDDLPVALQLRHQPLLLH